MSDAEKFANLLQQAMVAVVTDAKTIIPSLPWSDEFCEDVANEMTKAAWCVLGLALRATGEGLRI